MRYNLKLALHPSTSMALLQYADGLYVKSFKGTTIYDESNLNSIFVKEVDPSIYYVLR